tara:strand:+ start:18506 stop:18937 length:432 start_codon:yes stop_codon:yes gene_type:complete
MEILNELNKLLKKHDYNVEIQSLLTSKMLIVSKVNDETLPFTLAIGTYPKEEEGEESTFLQFYFQYTVDINQKKLLNLNETIISQNKLLPIGHFGINNEDNYLFYKYILVTSEKNMAESTILTVMNMVLYIMQAMLPPITDEL